MKRNKKAPLEGALVHPLNRGPETKGKSRPAVAKPILAPEYNPESEFQESMISAYDFHKRSSVNTKHFESGKTTVRGRIAVVRYYDAGRMAEAVKAKGGGWTLGFTKTQESDRHVPAQGAKYYVDYVRVDSQKNFQKLIESKEWASAKLLETFGGDAFGFDNTLTTPGIVGPPNDEYIPLLGGPFSKQLYLYDFLDMHAKCFWAKNHHPFAKAIVNIKRSYTIGKGVKLLFKNPDCQKSWDDFEKRASFQSKLRTDVETLVWSGEVMTEKLMVPDTESGKRRPSMAQIDPSTVWEIVTDPATPEVPLYFHQQFPTQWQLTYKQQDISSEYIINDIDASKVIFHKINTAPGEKRGRSDLFAVLSWLKRFRDYFNAKVVKAQMDESWFLDIAIDGSQADVDAIAQNQSVTRVPPAGSTRVHNKDVEYSYPTPTSSSTQGTDSVGDSLKNVIAIGAGIAPEWLGESAAGSTKETARAKEGPAQRSIEDLQQVTERYVRDIGEFVMAADKEQGFIPSIQNRPASKGMLMGFIQKHDWKKAAIEIAALTVGTMVTEPVDLNFEVIFPEHEGEERGAKIEAIMQGEAARYIKHTRAASMYASEMRITDYNAEDEMQAIQAEKDLGGGNEEWDEKEEDEDAEAEDGNKSGRPNSDRPQK